MSRDDYIKRADEELEQSYDEPLTIEEYVEQLFKNPNMASQAAKYIVNAIESLGTRTVIERGEERQRWRFFDDPYNNGEHAILGNTETLNKFVDDLRSIAANRGKEEKIIWIDGPTATGKSELKRCLINGLREYSKTEEGRRYTLEWNTNSTRGPGRGMSYGSSDASASEEDWYDSPVQTHPLAIFPPNVRQQIIDDLNESTNDTVPFNVDVELDPFSREAYETIEEHYRRQGENDLFSHITNPEHLRVKNYVMDIGQGIGVLHSEDTGNTKQRLVGDWMRGMLQKLDSRGRKNPQAFSYDGVLSQGNSGITIVEDAAQHADLLQKMLNVPDEESVKLDKSIKMDIDTLLLIISNPNLDAELNKHESRGGHDPLKALKRRLEKHQFNYLTNLSLEVQLLHRELTEKATLWEANDYEDLKQKIQSPLHLTVEDDGEAIERELAPHALEAAAMYTIVTRLDDDYLPTSLDLVDKAILYDKGYIEAGDEVRDKDSFDLNGNSADGKNGIPVTFTRDTIASLIQDELDRSHPELDVGNVVMPNDVLHAMVDRMNNEPVFSQGEINAFEDRLARVKQYVYDEQERDMLDAMMRDKTVDEETVREYVQHVYAWATDEEVENSRGETVDPDPLTMKVFEVEHLNRFTKDDYQNNSPKASVKSFRKDSVIPAINSYIWEHRDDEFNVDEINPKEISLFQNILSTHNWDAVQREYENLDPNQWDDPPNGTQTEEVKQKTIDNLIEMFDYSRESAELTSQIVMGEVAHLFDNE